MVVALGETFSKIEKKSKTVEEEIADDFKEESQKCKKEIELFQEKIKYYFLDLKQSDLYKYQTGVEKALENFEVIQYDVQIFQEKLKNFDYFTKMFEFPDKM